MSLQKCTIEEFQSFIDGILSREYADMRERVLGEICDWAYMKGLVVRDVGVAAGGAAAAAGGGGGGGGGGLEFGMGAEYPLDMDILELPPPNTPVTPCGDFCEAEIAALGASAARPKSSKDRIRWGVISINGHKYRTHPYGDGDNTLLYDMTAEHPDTNDAVGIIYDNVEYIGVLRENPYTGRVIWLYDGPMKIAYRADEEPGAQQHVDMNWNVAPVPVAYTETDLDRKYSEIIGV